MKTVFDIIVYSSRGNKIAAGEIAADSIKKAINSFIYNHDLKYGVFQGKATFKLQGKSFVFNFLKNNGITISLVDGPDEILELCKCGKFDINNWKIDKSINPEKIKNPLEFIYWYYEKRVYDIRRGIEDFKKRMNIEPKGIQFEIKSWGLSVSVPKSLFENTSPKTVESLIIKNLNIGEYNFYIGDVRFDNLWTVGFDVIFI